ncbi:hypothetical protein D3C77_710010 [compost metagenome]
MNIIRSNIVEQTLVVSNDQETTIFIAHRINTVSYDTKRIDVQTGVNFVQNNDFGFKQQHLQNFVTFLLTA